MSREPILERTRRAILSSAAAALGLSTATAAAGHPTDDGDHSAGGADGEEWREENDPDEPAFANAAAVGYHSMGGEGRAPATGRPDQVYDGNASQMDTHGDLAVLSFRVATADDPGRRLAVLDISEFNRAETRAELEDAELTVLGILRNHNAEFVGATDVKLSDDGNYAFLGTQWPLDVPFPGQGSYEARDVRAGVEATGGVVAVDISRPGSPRTAGSFTEGFSTGVHNLYHHRIDGTDYVFACKDVGLLSPDSGLYVLEFDRGTGQFALINRWTADGNTARGEVGPEHGLSYVHDVHVIDDPRTGRPTVYLADWDRGVRVLDATDPTDMEHVGQFDMHQAHETTPVPGLVEDADGNERRVLVASHEEPDHAFDQEDSEIYNTPHEDKTNPNSTGTVFLVDCDGIYPEDAEADHLDESDVRDHGDDPVQLGELDNWTWRNANSLDDLETTEADVQRVAFPSFSFLLSPHNQTVQKHDLQQPGLPAGVAYRNEPRWVLHQSHYNAGVRYLVIEPGTGRGLTGDDRRAARPEPNPNVEDREDDEEIGWINHTTDWNLRDVGHARPTNEELIGEDATPDFWCAVEHYGVTYCGDRNAGAYATHHDAIPVELARPPVALDRGVDPGLNAGGDTVEITLDIDVRGDGAVRVRDRLPQGYEVDDATVEYETYPNGAGTFVEFDVAIDDAGTIEYDIEPTGGTSRGALGPVSIREAGSDWDDVERWEAVEDQLETVTTVGIEEQSSRSSMSRTLRTRSPSPTPNDTG